MVHDVVLAISVTRAFSGLPTGGVSLSRFWANSVFCGLAARGLAERCGVLDSERLFVEGLLRDIGHLVMYHTVPEEAAEARRQSRASGQPLYLTERELLGFDFAELGAELMRAWKLPEPMVSVIRNHVESPADGEHDFETRIVYLASTLTAHYDTGEPAADWSLDPEALSAWQSVGLAIADLEPLVAAAERGVSEARELFVVMPTAA